MVNYVLVGVLLFIFFFLHLAAKQKGSYLRRWSTLKNGFLCICGWWRFVVWDRWKDTLFFSAAVSPFCCQSKETWDSSQLEAGGRYPYSSWGVQLTWKRENADCRGKGTRPPLPRKSLVLFQLSIFVLDPSSRPLWGKRNLVEQEQGGGIWKPQG